MIHKTFTLLFTFSSFFSFQAQSIRESRIAFYSDDKDRLKHAAILRDFYLDESPDSIYNIGSFLIKKGLASENLAYLNYGKHIISRYYFEHGKTDVALQNLGEARAYYERRGDLKNLADAQNMTGLAYLYRQQEKQAVHWFVESLKTAGELPEESESYMAQFNLAEAFYRLEDYVSAEKELASFIAKVKKQKLNKGLRRAYSLMGKICFAKDQAVDGLDYCLKSVRLAYENGDKLGLSFAKNDLAIAYFQLGDPLKAKQAFEESLQLRKAINKPAQVCESYYNLGEYYFSETNYPAAIIYFDSCVQLAGQNSFLAEKSDALGRIGECYKLNGNIRQAYAYLEQYATAQNELLSQAKKDAYVLEKDLEKFRPGELRLRQSIRERELQKRIDKAEANARWLLILTVLICAVSIGLLFRKAKLKP